jgi:CheY-like chemotaxis protein
VATILIVDDEQANRELLGTILSKAGHTLFESTNGVEALSLAKAKQPDLIVMDLHMPAMGGTQFVKELRSDPALAHVKIALYTATMPDASMRQFMELSGITCAIPKPSGAAEVLRLIAAALA